MKTSKIIAKATEANKKANEYAKAAVNTGDAKLAFLAYGYRMEALRWMKKVA